MKQEPRDVQPMAGYISIRKVVKKSSIIELTNDQKEEMSMLVVDAMGTGTEEMTEARVDDVVCIILDPKNSVAYGYKDMDMKDARILVKPENIAAILTPRKNRQIN